MKTHTVKRVNTVARKISPRASLGRDDKEGSLPSVGKTGTVTEIMNCELKPSIAKRAIIMAAGIGQRMRPVTNTVPKPLIKVNGVRMINSVVDALQQNGIRSIYVVTGYLKEQFEGWAKHRPGVRLIENPYYDTCNNISSLYMAREYLGDCMILDGDQLILNPAVEDGIVTSCSRTGGKRGWQLYSVSRWTKEDGQKLRRHLEQEFEGGNRQIYWDDVAMFCHPEDYKLGVYPMGKDDVKEIDSFEELIQLDPTYSKEEPEQ